MLRQDLKEIIYSTYLYLLASKVYLIYKTF
jgi:hypothetical protein